MKHLRNEKGIALVMVLVLSLISLAFVSAMLYMITQGTQMSGAMRMVRTAEEASFGGAAISADFVKDNIAPALHGGPVVPGLAERGVLPAPFLATSSDACLAQKLTLARSLWSQCNAQNLLLDPVEKPDFRITLGGFSAVGKIVDMVEGNSDTGGLVTGGGDLRETGVVRSDSGVITPPQIPYLYSIEVQAQDSTSARERSRVSVLYAY